MLATVHFETLQGVPVARVEGEVDASNAGTLTTEITEAVPNSAMGLVLDLCETTYLDSSGLQMLFEIADRLRRRQQVLHMVIAAESFVSDVLNAVNIESLAVQQASVADAVATLKQA